MYFDLPDLDLKMYCIGTFCLLKCTLYFILSKCVIPNRLNALKEKIWHDLNTEVQTRY